MAALMVDELLDVAFRSVLRFFGYVFIEIIGHIFFYFTGYSIIKAVTLGKRPVKTRIEHFDTTTGWHIMTLGFAFWAVVAVILLVVYVG